MSSWCRKALAAPVLALAGSSAAWAQQTYFVPSVETSAEYNSNWELAPESQKDPMASYKAGLSARIGRRTQLTSIELRPRITVQEFPDRSGVDPVEYFLDLRTTRTTQRSNLLIGGSFSRRDAFSAEYGTATFNELNPELSKVDDTGIIFRGSTRTAFSFDPRYEYAITERSGLGAQLDVDHVRYDPENLRNRTGFDSYTGQVFYSRNLAQRTEFTVGPFAGKFKTDNDTNDTDIYGVAATIHHDWSTISYMEVSLNVEKDDATLRDDTTGIVTQDKSTAWGLAFTGFRRNRVGGFRYTVGRSIDPSSFGDRRTIDQVRLQFERPLSPLTSFLAAGRFTHEVPVGDDSGSDTRDRFFGELSLRHQLTPQWYVSGGYRLGWQDIENQGSFQNHGVFLSVGFRGRDPERMR